MLTFGTLLVCDPQRLNREARGTRGSFEARTASSRGGHSGSLDSTIGFPHVRTCVHTLARFKLPIVIMPRRNPFQVSIEMLSCRKSREDAIVRIIVPTGCELSDMCTVCLFSTQPCIYSVVDLSKDRCYQAFVQPAISSW